MLVAGATVLRKTSRAPKSVCVSSSDLGPRSRDLGGLDCIRRGVVVCRVRRRRGEVGVRETVARRGRVEDWIRREERVRVWYIIWRSIVACRCRGIGCERFGLRSVGVGLRCSMNIVIEFMGGPSFLAAGAVLLYFSLLCESASKKNHYAETLMQTRVYVCCR